jgi:hypothetical protein
MVQGVVGAVRVQLEAGVAALVPLGVVGAALVVLALVVLVEVA